MRNTGLGKGVVRLSLVVTEVLRAGGIRWKNRSLVRKCPERTIL